MSTLIDDIETIIARWEERKKKYEDKWGNGSSPINELLTALKEFLNKQKLEAS